MWQKNVTSKLIYVDENKKRKQTAQASRNRNLFFLQEQLHAHCFAHKVTEKPILILGDVPTVGQLVALYIKIVLRYKICLFRHPFLREGLGTK
jgi:hypothetical protein